MLNEIDIEHHWSPEAYTKFYDAVTAAMLKVDPDIKFMAVFSAHPRNHGEMYESFLNPAHHAPGTHLDFLTYRFYASPPEPEPFSNMQYTFFDQADGFLATTAYVEQIKRRLSPNMKTDLNELGVILSEDSKSNRIPGYNAKPSQRITGACSRTSSQLDELRCSFYRGYLLLRRCTEARCSSSPFKSPWSAFK